MGSIFIAAPQIKMKKNLFRAFLLWLALLISMPANAYGIEDADLDPMATEYDGYLIAMSDDMVPNMASLEYIAPDVYLTEDEEFANELLDTGYADYMNIPAVGNRHSGETETANPVGGNRESDEMGTAVPAGGNRLQRSCLCGAQAEHVRRRRGGSAGLPVFNNPAL